MPRKWQCDQDDDCGDSSDERGCGRCIVVMPDSELTDSLIKFEPQGPNGMDNNK